MALVKTKELSRAALDWAVSRAQGDQGSPREWLIEHDAYGHDCFSDDWSQGGKIIENEVICSSNQYQGLPSTHPHFNKEQWICNINGKHTMRGSTNLIAAMRCYVAAKLGLEVDVPDEILEVAAA